MVKLLQSVIVGLILVVGFSIATPHPAAGLMTLKFGHLEAQRAADLLVRIQTAPSEFEIQSYGGLLRAVSRSDVQETKKLLASGANVNQTDGHGRTPLRASGGRTRRRTGSHA